MNQINIKIVVLFIVLGHTVSIGWAQVNTPGFVDYDYHRVMSIRGDSSFSYSFIQDAIKYESDLQLQMDPWSRYSGNYNNDGFQRTAVLIKSTYKSGYAKTMNDGALWYGRGLTQEIHAGFQWRKGILD